MRRSFIETKILFVGLLVGLAHLVAGIAVLVEPSALHVTPLAGLVNTARLVGWGYGEGQVGTILIIAGLMAIIGGSDKGASRVLQVVLFLPQQLLLLLQIWTISVALIHGTYPDGYAPQGGAWFILADQIWAFVLAVSHSIWLAAFLYGSRDDGIDGAA